MTTPEDALTVKPDGGERSDQDFVPVPLSAINALELCGVKTVVAIADPPRIETAGFTVIVSSLLTDTPRASVAVIVS